MGLLGAEHWQHCRGPQQGVADISMHQPGQKTCTMMPGRGGEGCGAEGGDGGRGRAGSRVHSNLR